MGDVIREETKRRGPVADEKNTGEVMKELRKQHGDTAVGNLCMKAIKESGAEMVVVDGVRSAAEVEVFRESAKVILVAVHASRPRRFELLRQRGRSDDPLSYEMFLRRDERELGIGIGTAIALADEIGSNEHATPESLSSAMVAVVDEWVAAAGA